MNAALATETPVFACERLADCMAEILAIVPRHYADLGMTDLSPEIATFQAIDAQDRLRVHTLRSGSQLVGYCVLMVFPSLNTGLLEAHERMVYVLPEFSGHVNFIRLSDNAIIRDGVRVIRRACRVGHDHGAILSRLRYEPEEQWWARIIPKQEA